VAAGYRYVWRVWHGACTTCGNRGNSSPSGVNFAMDPWENTMMKYVAVALALATALVTPVAAHANPNDLICKITNNKAKDCEQPTTVPEPGDLTLLSTGIAGLGAFSFLRRKGQSKHV
jgi:hypothetical protein